MTEPTYKSASPDEVTVVSESSENKTAVDGMVGGGGYLCETVKKVKRSTVTDCDFDVAKASGECSVEPDNAMTAYDNPVNTKSTPNDPNTGGTDGPPSDSGASLP